MTLAVSERLRPATAAWLWWQLRSLGVSAPSRARRGVCASVSSAVTPSPRPSAKSALGTPVAKPLFIAPQQDDYETKAGCQMILGKSVKNTRCLLPPSLPAPAGSRISWRRPSGVSASRSSPTSSPSGTDTRSRPAPRSTACRSMSGIASVLDEPIRGRVYLRSALCCSSSSTISGTSSDELARPPCEVICSSAMLTRALSPSRKLEDEAPMEDILEEARDIPPPPREGEPSPSPSSGSSEAADFRRLRSELVLCEW
eukprot:scaffold7905_cov62-Phaeocystis_antarctica.AAC.6